MTCDDSDGSSSCGGGRRKGRIGHDDAADNVTISNNSDRTQMVVAAAQGATGFCLQKPFFILQTQWLRESACCPFSTHSMPSGANS